MLLTSNAAPQVSDYRSCLQFYRDVMGFSLVNGDEKSSSSLLRRGNTSITLIQSTISGRPRTAMVCSIVRKRK